MSPAKMGSVSTVDMAPYIARLRVELRNELGQSPAFTAHLADERCRMENVLFARGIETVRELEILMLALGWTEMSWRWARVMMEA